jgi:hypothetical protein
MSAKYSDPMENLPMYRVVCLANGGGGVWLGVGVIVQVTLGVGVTVAVQLGVGVNDGVMLGVTGNIAASANFANTVELAS